MKVNYLTSKGIVALKICAFLTALALILALMLTFSASAFASAINLNNLKQTNNLAVFNYTTTNSLAALNNLNVPLSSAPLNGTAILNSTALNGTTTLNSTALNNFAPPSSPTAALKKVALPIIMYHSILKTKNTDYILSIEKLEQDFKFIVENNFTTVTVTDVINYATEGASLPTKPIMLTFDDGHYNNYVYVLPLLKKYNLKCVISIVGAFSANNTPGSVQSISGGHLTFEQVKLLAQTPYIEIQHHSYNLHKITSHRRGVRRATGESYDSYKQMFIADTKKLNDILRTECDAVPNAYVYPYGCWSLEAYEILNELGFKAMLTCEEGINYIDRQSSLNKLKRFNRSGKYSTYEFFVEHCKIKID